MTFFFDGVPPLTGEEEIVKNSNMDSKLQNLTQKNQEPVWYVHEPQKDCTTCHGRRGQQEFSSQTYLTAPVPELCYGCHTNYTTSAPYVHGPVAVGQCLFCHNQHKSKIKHLLKEQEPKLCYLCHDISAVEKIPVHLVDPQSACTDCHNPHASSTKALLKSASFQANETSDGTKAISTTIQDYIQAEEEKQKHEEGSSGFEESIYKTSFENTSLYQMLWTVGKLVEQGNIQMAKTYLGKYKDNSAFTNEERRKIAQLLQQMDIVATTDGVEAEKIDHETSSPKMLLEESSAESETNSDQLSKRKKEIAELYYSSVAFYHDGQFEKAQEGLLKVLNSGLVPEPMVKTIRVYLQDIEKILAKRTKSLESES